MGRPQAIGEPLPVDLPASPQPLPHLAGGHTYLSTAEATEHSWDIQVPLLYPFLSLLLTFSPAA